MSVKSKYRPLPRCILRTPMFPTAMAGNTDLPKNSAIFKEALFIASPDLFGGTASDDPKKRLKYEESLLKYQNRACTRCTPFGLFAGCSVGRLAENTRIVLPPQEQDTRCTRLDMQYLCALIQQIEQLPEVRSRLRYYPNDSLYELGGKLRYIEYRYRKAQRLHNVIALEIDDTLRELLAAAEHGATVDELANRLQDEEVSHDEAVEYIHEVIDSQVLKSELDPCVVGEDVLTTLIAKLELMTEVPILETLKRIQGLLQQIDSKPVGTTLPLYTEIIEAVKQTGVGYDPKCLFQTDLFKPTPQATIAAQITDKLAGLIDFLAKTSVPGENQTLANFTRAFQSRYEDREIPLLTVLDSELGLGYPEPVGNGNETFLNDIAIPGRRSHTTDVRLTPVDRILFNKYIESVRSGGDTVYLKDEDFKDLSFSPQLPDTFPVMCSLLGGERIYLRSCGGSSGANLLGRFCHLDDGIRELVAEVASIEQQLSPEVLFAEISHLPESRIGNIASRPVLRDYTLHYLSNCEHDGHDIPVSDLMLSVKNGRLFLRSRKYDKEVIPRLTCAHNYSMSPIPVYRFLCDMQSQGKTPGLYCGWNNLFAGMEYMPRIQYGEIVLTRQRWRLKEDEVKGFEKLGDDELDDKIQALLANKRIPPRVLIPDSDNELYLDLRQPGCRRLLLTTISKRREIILEEFLFDDANAVVRDTENAYTNEVIFIFQKRA